MSEKSPAINNESGEAELHEHIRGRAWIADMALGLSDGMITSLSFLTGFAGVITSLQLVRVAGAAAMLAGSVSMFFGGFMATRADYDLFQADSDRESYEITHEPEEERRELKEFYLRKGLTENEAETVVSRITSSKESWLEDMLLHELHLHRGELGAPLNVGCVLGASFMLGAFVPLLPYLLFASKLSAVVVSLIASLIFLFAVGALRGNIAKKNIWKRGAETLLIGITGSAILYIIGIFLSFV